MNPDNQSTEDTLPLVEETAEVMGQVSEYGHLILGSLYFIVGGMLVVFLLHMLASKYLYPRIGFTRLAKVVFGTLYVLVLVVTVSAFQLRKRARQT